MKNKLIKNTIIIIICSFVVKMLGLINRIIITRLLGSEGIGLYVIVIPSIMLFLSIGGLSLNIAVTKIASENNVTNKYSSKKILKQSFKIGLISSLITIFFVLIISKYLANTLLKQPLAFYPLIASCLFIPLVAFNNCLRGYLNGINLITKSAYASLFEQIFRMAFGILFLYLFSPFGVTVAVTSAILAMGIGELASFFYAIIVLKRNFKSFSSVSDKNENATKEIINIALPTTLSRLTGNLTYFLEPILYTLSLTIVGFTSQEILYHYSSVSAYIIPLITIASFIPSSIATVIIPKISEYNAVLDTEKTNSLIKKTIILSLIPAIIVTILLIFYSEEYMILIYDTNSGAMYVKRLALLFCVFYIQAPLVASLQAIGYSKKLFLISLITSILKLSILFILPFVLRFPFESLIYTLLFNTILSTFLYYFILKKKTSLTWKFSELSNILLLIILIIPISLMIKTFISNFLLSSLFISLIYFLMIKVLRFF